MIDWTKRKEVRSAIVGKHYVQIRRMSIPGMSRKVYFWAVVSDRGVVKQEGSVSRKPTGDKRTYYEIAMGEAVECALALSDRRKNPAFGRSYWTPAKRMKAARSARKAIEDTAVAGARPSARKNPDHARHNPKSNPHKDFKPSYTRNAQGGLIVHSAKVPWREGFYLLTIFKSQGTMEPYFWYVNRETKAGNITKIADGTDYSLAKAKKSIATSLREKMHRKNPLVISDSQLIRNHAKELVRLNNEMMSIGVLSKAAKKRLQKRYEEAILEMGDVQSITSANKRSFKSLSKARNNPSFARVRRMMMGQVPSIRTIGIMTAHNPQGKELAASKNNARNKTLVRTLRNMGYGPIPVDGKYGLEEDSFVIPNITRKDTAALGIEFDQQSVVWGSRQGSGRNKRMVWQYIEKDKTINTRDVSLTGKDIQSRKDFFSMVKGRKFAIPFFEARYKPMTRTVGPRKARANLGAIGDIEAGIKAEKILVKKIDSKMRKR